MSEQHICLHFAVAWPEEALKSEDYTRAWQIEKRCVECGVSQQGSASFLSPELSDDPELEEVVNSIIDLGVCHRWSKMKRVDPSLFAYYQELEERYTEVARRKLGRT